ncbi:UDP-glucose 4-epimerase GalE [Sutcliffiella sp. NPDC057660]|uniref:UDP-glucose 4-epimerase GalE n=1 Tax=Sutcliffiella sp. NPDC057660 TaxID=3346199 RepID=UPI0036B4B2B2
MAILVTGGAGYIGSHTCIELLNAGYELVVLDNLVNSKFESVRRVKELTNKEFPFYKVDLLHIDKLEEIFKENTIDAVIHLAGLKAVGESVEQPLFYYHNNITGTLNLCKVMSLYGVKNLVFSSSATVYGLPDSVPITENSPLQAKNPYGQTKLMIEQVLQDLYQSDKEWSISLLRYFNPIGAHESGRLGEDPQGIPNNLMPYITQVAIGKLPELHIFGNNYSTADGTGVRDYIHVVDLAKGHVCALEKVWKTTGVDAFNLGTGKGYSVLEIVQAFEKASGVEIPFRVIGPRPGDIGACYADPIKAKINLGWQAQRGLEEMCRDAWRWQEQNPLGYETNKKDTTLKLDVLL